MPSKTNTKGSGAKNQAKPTSQTNAKTGNGSNTNTAASTSLQSNSKSLPSETRQPPHLPVPEADKTRPDPNLTPFQESSNDQNKEGGGVNKKKQKRRLKEAAKRAAEETEIIREMDKVRTGTFKSATKQPPTYNGQGQANSYDYEASDYDDQDRYEPDELEYYSDAGVQQDHSINFRSTSSHLNGNEDHNQDPETGAKSKKKRKNKPATTGIPLQPASTIQNQNSFQHPTPPPPPPPAPTIGNSYLPSGSHHDHHIQKQHNIWNTSTTEERENIKEFWLSLGEEDRRSLVKVEKEAVLKKMKEQQKYSCSCTVCGRKRTAIEEELEVLYDAYYEELEQYANHQQINLDNGAPIIPQPQLYHPMSRPRQHIPQAYNQSHRARLQELEEGDDPGDLDDESELGEDDDLSDEYDNSEDPPQNSAATDFFNFGNSLTVQGMSRPGAQY